MQMTLSLLEGNLMPAHLLADAVCLGLSALMLPPLWIFSGLLSAAVFVATVSCLAWSISTSVKLKPKGMWFRPSCSVKATGKRRRRSQSLQSDECLSWISSSRLKHAIAGTVSVIFSDA